MSAAVKRPPSFLAGLASATTSFGASGGGGGVTSTGAPDIASLDSLSQVLLATSRSYCSAVKSVFSPLELIKVALPSGFFLNVPPLFPGNVSGVPSFFILS
jgi:hypothetical protein